MEVKVRDLMTTDVITISPEAPLKEAAVVMGRHNVSGLPVLEDGNLVGIITQSDFVTRLARQDDVGLMSLLFRRGEGESSATVGEAMTSDLRTIGPDDSVSGAARMMADEQVNRLPVVSPDGALLGLVTRADLMGVFARPDEQIAADIAGNGVAGLIGADPDSVRVSVIDGVVRLEGSVGTVTERRMLEEFSRGVTGVVRVDSELRASFDDTRLPPL